MREKYSDNRQDPISLLEYFLVIAKYSRMILMVTLCAAVISTTYSLALHNVYTAKVMIVPGDDDKGMMGAMLAQIGSLAAVTGGIGTATKTDLYVTMLKSETIMDPIIDRFNLMSVYHAKLRAQAYSKINKSVTISAGKMDGVLSISVDAKDPKLAAAIANAYVEELGKVAAGLDMAGASKTRAFLEGRLTNAKADLAQAEDALKEFQSKNKAISVTDQAKASIEGLAQLRGQLAIQEVELNTLRRQFTDTSQEVKTAVATVANFRNQIAKLEGNGNASSIPSVGAMPQLGQEYVRLLREFKIQETLVELLTKQYEMVKINESKDVSPFQVLQRAKQPEVKSKPKRAFIVIMATFTSVFVSVFLAFALEYFNGLSEENRIKWDEIKNCLRFKK